MKKTKDTQYLFLSANIRALQTKMVGTQALQKMISAASPEEAYKTVNDAVSHSFNPIFVSCWKYLES